MTVGGVILHPKKLYEERNKFEERINEKKAFVRNKEEGKMMKQRRMKRKKTVNNHHQTHVCFSPIGHYCFLSTGRGGYYWISGSCVDGAENSRLLRCKSMLAGERLPTFRRAFR